MTGARLVSTHLVTADARPRVAAASIVCESLDEEVLIFDRRTGRRYALAGTGARIWQGLVEGRSPDAIAASLGGEADTVRDDVRGFCAELCAEGLLWIADAAGETRAASTDVAASVRPHPPSEPGPSAACLPERRAIDAHGFLPDPSLVPLLRAALLDGDAARVAFEEWRTQLDVATLDLAAWRLLPLLHHNLRRQRIAAPPPLAARLADAYCRQWYRMQHLVTAAADVIAQLSRAGVGTLVLKGLPLCLREYPSPATRPMTDIDILVPAADVERALAVFAAAGWSPEYPAVAWPTRLCPSSPFHHASGWDVDLHTSVLHGRRGPDADEDLWRRSEPLRVGEVATRTLAPDDLLLHVITHGAWRKALSPVRWAVDAAMIVRRAGDAFEWDRFVRTAAARGLSLFARQGLGYLDATVGVPIPRGVLAALAATRIAWLERLEAASRACSGRSAVAAFYAVDWARARADVREWRGPLGFAHYLAERWQLDSLWRLPPDACRRLIARRGGPPPAAHDR